MRAHASLFALAFVTTAAGLLAYGKLARRLGIVAVPNERTLHKGNIVRGGGVVVAAIFLAAVAWLFAGGELTTRWFIALFVGGAAVSALGFIDDIVHLSTGVRIVIHALVAALATACIGPPLELGSFGYGLGIVGMIWMINLYNFMDGIDGMAASGATFFSAASAGLLLSQGRSALAVPLVVLACASIAFLIFNWPPARLFMGDSGSGFYGYVFGVFVLISDRVHHLSVWTWLILFGYFISDTTTTTLIRAVTMRRFWHTHRSHAYQNLARIWDNHRRMTLLVIAIEVIWLLPLAVGSMMWPELGIAFTAIAVAPLVLFAVKYGPLYAR